MRGDADEGLQTTEEGRGTINGESLTLRVERGGADEGFRRRTTDNRQQSTDELSTLILFINVIARVIRLTVQDIHLEYS